MFIQPTSSPTQTVQTAGGLTPLKSVNSGAARFVETAPAKPPETVKAPAPIVSQLGLAISTVNKFIEPVAKNLQFNVDDDSGQVVVKLVDSETNEVLRQFPTDQMLAIANMLDKFQGMLLELDA